MTQSKEKACFSPKISNIKESKTFTTAPTNERKHKNNIHRNSMYKNSKSMPFPIDSTLEDLDLFGGKMVHYSFDCPLNLRTAFNKEIIDNGDTGCQEQRRFMAIYVVNSMNKKHALGNTLSKLVDANFSIGEMNFTQNVQSKTRRLINNGETKVLSNHEPKILFPAPKTCILEKKKKIIEPLVTWSGKRIDLEKSLEEWANLTLDERLDAGKYAKAFPHMPGASKVLKWYFDYMLAEKGKGS